MTNCTTFSPQSTIATTQSNVVFYTLYSQVKQIAANAVPNSGLQTCDNRLEQKVKVLAGEREPSGDEKIIV